MLAYWEIHVTRYDGSAWSPSLVLPGSNGRNDMMPASTMSADGNVWAAWATDSRNTRSYLPQHLRVNVARVGERSGRGLLRTKPLNRAAEQAKFLTLDEARHVARIRAHAIKHRGKTFSIFRGDLHRHTDISVDGNNDGSLLDAYRYARDAAMLDFVGVADHTDAVDDAYAWWRSQKVADIFQQPGGFVAFYGYERSVEYPNGHRNIFFASRGNDILPVGSFERVGVEGAGGLYWYLRRSNGFSIPHTTGRTSGTDWRDNDPEVENLLEIYQGMRDSYEYPRSPRPHKLWSTWLDPNAPVPRASSDPRSPSFRPLGFVWNALAKGYKLGFIAASDHISSHISYGCVIAEELTLDSLLEAIRARRAYAATDNIIMDIRYHGSDGENLVGEVFATRTPLRIRGRVIGTGEILQIDIIRDGEILHTVRPAQEHWELDFVDSKPQPGESYYYVRVAQKNGEMAWGSPAWVTHGK
jgi:hypothetical protein